MLSLFLTFLFLLCLLLKQFSKYFSVFQRASYNLHHANCPSSHLTASLFVLVRLKDTENVQFSHPMEDIEGGGEFTQLLKPQQIPNEFYFSFFYLSLIFFQYRTPSSKVLNYNHNCCTPSQQTNTILAMQELIVATASQFKRG